MKLTIEF